MVAEVVVVATARATGALARGALAGTSGSIGSTMMPEPLPPGKRSAGMEAWSKRRANKQARKGGGKGGK